MESVGKLLQLAGLTVPVLAIFAQLSEAISIGQMLLFLVASVCIFYIGAMLQSTRR